MASSSKKSAGKANLLGKRKLEDGFETKPITRKHKEKETKKQNKGRVELSEIKSDEANLISVKRETVEGLHETPEEAATVRNKTLFVSNLSGQTETSDIINFFKDVAQVVHIRLTAHSKGQYGFVEFASSNEAKKALEKKNGEYLHYSKIILDETPYFAEEVLLITNLCPQTTKPKHIIDFFKDVGEVVRVRLVVDPYGDLMGCGFVEFASANEAKRALQEKNDEYLHDRKISLYVANMGATYLPPPKYCIDHKVWNEEDYLQGESLPIEVDAAVEGLDETLDNVEEVDVRKKTLFMIHLAPQTTQSDIINLFKDVAQVVNVRLILDRKGKYKYGNVEFASPNEAKKALEKKNGGYLNCYKIILVESSDFAEEVLLIANLSAQTNKPKHIIRFFEDIGKVISVRLIVNHEGKNVGYGFVQFDTSDEAKKALEEMNGEYLDDHQILLMKGLDTTPDFAQTVGIVRNKTLFVDNLSPETEMSDIISLFKDSGEVVHVRLFVDYNGHLKPRGFVGFASANEATKAMEKKNGEYLHNSKIFVGMADTAGKILERLPTHYIDHNVWYEDYIQRESLLLEEDVAADETPDFAEEVSVRKRTVFVAKLPQDTTIIEIINRFKCVGEVVCVRLIVDQWGEHVGCCFVEFSSVDEAEKAVQWKDGYRFHVNIAEVSAPYPFRPKFNLADLAKKLWYEDNFLRKNLTRKSGEVRWIKCITRIPKKQFMGKRTIFGDDDC